MIVIAKLKAKSGHESAMEEALRNIIPEVEKEADTLVYALHKAQNNPGVFLFYEKYTDADALMQHSATPHFKALFKTLQPLLDGAPEIETYDMVAAIAPK